jgi:predicted HTH transcriptional regulator
MNLREFSLTEENLTIFKQLIQQQESEVLDFKCIPYNLSDDKKQLDLVKDVVCMYNTPREQDAYILLGVGQSNGTVELTGIDEYPHQSHLDLSNLQAPFLVKYKIEPFPRFTIDIIYFENRRFGIIKIPVNKNGPCKSVENYGGMLKSGQIYFRRASTNDITRTPEEVYEIMHWFMGKSNQLLNLMNEFMLKNLEDLIHHVSTFY